MEIKTGDQIKYDTEQSMWPAYGAIKRVNPKTVTLEDGTKVPKNKIVKIY